MSNASEEPELSGKHGVILHYDSERLSVFVTGTRKLSELSSLPGASDFTEGDGEGTVHLPNSLLDTAASVIGAKRNGPNTLQLMCV